MKIYNYVSKKPNLDSVPTDYYDFIYTGVTAVYAGVTRLYVTDPKMLANVLQLLSGCKEFKRLVCS